MASCISCICVVSSGLDPGIDEQGSRGPGHRNTFIISSFGLSPISLKKRGRNSNLAWGSEKARVGLESPTSSSAKAVLKDTITHVHLASGCYM